MNRLFIAAAIAAAAFTTAALAADVGVSVRIGEPGFYGQLEIGDAGRPSVINSRPSLITRAPRGVVYEPLYLRVPARHQNNWRRYCRNYGVCDRPVYFVKDDWYNDVYVPHYRDQHREDRRDYRDYRDDANRNNHDDRGYRGEDNDHGKARNHG
jgi:hypothetical protein